MKINNSNTGMLLYVVNTTLPKQCIFIVKISLASVIKSSYLQIYSHLLKEFFRKVSFITHFITLVSFYTPRKHRFEAYSKRPNA